MVKQEQTMQSNVNPTMVNFDVVKFLGGTDNSTYKFTSALFNMQVVVDETTGKKSLKLGDKQLLTGEGRFHLGVLIAGNLTEISKLSYTENFEQLSKDKALFLNNLAKDFAIHQDEWFINREKDMNFVYNLFREFIKNLKDSTIKGFTMKKLGESVSVNNNNNTNDDNNQQKKRGFGFFK